MSRPLSRAVNCAMTAASRISLMPRLKLLCDFRKLGVIAHSRVEEGTHGGKRFLDRLKR